MILAAVAFAGSARAEPLHDAVADTKSPAFGKWIFATHNIDITRTDVPAAPPEVEHVVAALVAWDRARATFHIDCDTDHDGNVLEMFPALVDIAHSALLLARGPDDPRFRAVLHLGQVLRSADNGQSGVVIGARLAADAATWLAAHHAKAPALLSAYAPESDLLSRFVRAGERCALTIAPRWLDAAAKRGEHVDANREMSALRAYCTRAAKALLATSDPDELAKLNTRFSDERPLGITSVTAGECEGDGAKDLALWLRAYRDALATPRAK